MVSLIISMKIFLIFIIFVYIKSGWTAIITAENKTIIIILFRIDINYSYNSFLYNQKTCQFLKSEKNNKKSVNLN